MPIRQAKLYLTCGLPGSGKTTLARKLERERGAVRLTADEWLHRLYPNITTAEGESGPERGRVESLQWDIALRLLGLGRDVVIDWGVWSREERDFYRSAAQGSGARVVLCVLDPPLDELWRRLARRNADRPFGAFEISREELLGWSVYFARPTAEELALYDDHMVESP